MPQDLTPLLIYPNVPAGLVLRSTGGGGVLISAGKSWNNY